MILEFVKTRFERALKAEDEETMRLLMDKVSEEVDKHADLLADMQHASDPVFKKIHEKDSVLTK